MGNDVEPIQKIGNLCRRDESGENESTSKLQLVDALFEIRLQNSITDPDEFQSRELSAQFGCELDEIVMALQIKQPRDRTDRDVIVFQSQVAPHGVARDGRIHE